ncbi:MAG: hypothetical protein IH932_01830 [Thaumarchaeota archaeon]|nr:hypothetical protein [Nitrososphaerota archaeon]
MGSSEQQKRISVKVSLDDDELSTLKKVLGSSSLNPQVLAALIPQKISWLEEKVLIEELSELRTSITRLKAQIHNLTIENEEMERKLQIARSDGLKLTSKVDALEIVRSNLEITWNSKKNSKVRWILRRR